jgi:hypothetical protein
VAPDPRRYSATEQTPTVGLPSATETGFGAPFGAPIGFGGAGAGGDVTVTNDGDLAARPVLTISGPVLNPVVRNNTTGEELRFGIDVAAGDFLTVDTAARTVLLNGTANRRNALLQGSRWPRVAPGSNTFQFRAASSDPAAMLGVRFRSAWA